MKQYPLPMALRCALIMAVGFLILPQTVNATELFNVDHGDLADLGLYCASGCNLTDDSYTNDADGLWGERTTVGTVGFAIRAGGDDSEHAYAHWAYPMTQDRGDITPESLQFQMIACSWAGAAVGTMSFSPDNSTWYEMTYNETCGGWKNMTTYSNLTQDKIMDFINSSNSFNIYIKPNQTATSTQLIWRGFRVEATLGFNSSERQVSNCSNPSHKKAVAFNFYDESAPTATLNGTINNIQFDYSLANGTERSMALVYDYNTTLQVCIYPSTENFTTDMQAQYLATNYSHRHWYFTNARLDNITDVVNLYLINNTLDDQIAVHVRDENLGDKEGAEVRVMRWMPPAYNTGTILKTNTEGKAYAWVDKDEWYKFQVLYNGTLYKTTEPTQLIAYDTSTPYVIDVAFAEAVPYINWVSGIGYTFNYRIRASDGVLYELFVTDTTGLMATAFINVTHINSTTVTNVCSKSGTGTSFTLTCVPINEPKGFYTCQAYMLMDDGEYWLIDKRTGQYGEPETKVGGDGLIMAAVFVGTVAFAGLLHPVLAVFMTIIGLVAVTAMQLALISWASVIAILGVGLVVVYVISRGGQNK